MLKTRTLTLMLGMLLLCGGTAFGELCTIDQVPAATLLIPYFEVSLEPDGMTTLFSINNATPDAVVAHVTVWTDWSVPALDFDVYLTGFDVQVINVRDFFNPPEICFLPVTGSEVSNQGDFSNPNTDFPSCNNTDVPGNGPVYQNPAISPEFQAHLIAWMTGEMSPATGDCAGSGQGNGNLTGYITVDAVQDCNLLFPSSATYWGGGIASLDNVLWGEYFYADASTNSAQAFPAVHIEADASLTTGLDATFYGRYSGGLDGREPLPTTFAVRYASGGAFDGTDVMIWREGSAAAAAVACGSTPSWYPLDFSNQTGNQSSDGAVIAFDEEENPVIVITGPSGFPFEGISVPNETQRLRVGEDISTGAFDFGWLYMNLQNSAAISPSPGQAWVTQRWNNSGRFSGGWNAMALDSGCSPTVINP